MRQAARLCETSPQPHNSLGTFLNAMGRKDDALLAFREAINRDPDDISSWHAIVTIFKETGRHDEEEEGYANLLRLQPSYYWWD